MESDSHITGWGYSTPLGNISYSGLKILLSCTKYKVRPQNLSLPKITTVQEV